MAIQIGGKQAYCVVAVGSTKFEELIKELDTLDFYLLLESAGITSVLFQIGSGKYRPCLMPNYFTVEVHSFIVLEDYIKHANMVISHCGAGILLESLRALNNPQIIAVVNTTLMENHQAELADQLENDKLVYKAETGTVLGKLAEVVRVGRCLERLAPRTDGLLLDIIDEMLR